MGALLVATGALLRGCNVVESLNVSLREEVCGSVDLRPVFATYITAEGMCAD